MSKRLLNDTYNYPSSPSSNTYKCKVKIIPYVYVMAYSLVEKYHKKYKDEIGILFKGDLYTTTSSEKDLCEHLDRR